MRRAILLLTVMTTALVVASGVALAAVINCPPGGNPCLGTSDADMMNGTTGDDDMHGLRGGDTLNAGAGFDQLKGERGEDTLNGEADNDTLVGGSGGDSFEAGPGADTIKAADNEADQIDCGGGNDTVFFDQGLDTFVNAAACEDKRPS